MLKAQIPRNGRFSPKNRWRSRWNRWARGVEWMAQQKKAEAEEVISSLMKDRPNDLLVRLNRALLWGSDPDTRGKAIDLLTDTRDEVAEFAGFRAVLLGYRDVQRIVLLTQLRIDAYPKTATAEQAQLRKLIDDGCQQASRLLSAENPRVLKLTAAAMLLDDDPRKRSEAIALLQKAADAADAQGQPDMDLLLKLADQYQSVHQLGQVARVLSRILQLRPELGDLRVRLVNTLLNDRQYERARAIVVMVPTQWDSDPTVVRWKVILYAQADQDFAKAAEQVAKLPESDNKQRLYKAALAATCASSIRSRDTARRRRQVRSQGSGCDGRHGDAHPHVCHQ